MSGQPTHNLPGEDNSQFTAPPSQAQSNPFTGDLKGEFTSNFGTNTNAVSKIFEGGIVGQNRTKIYIAAGLAVLVLAFVGYMFLGDSDPGFEEEVMDEGFVENSNIATSDEMINNEIAENEAVLEGNEVVGNEVEGAAGEMATEGYAEETMPGDTLSEAAGSATVAATGTITLASPVDGSARSYDEASAPAVFEWEGINGGTIVFSRSPDMSVIERKVNVTGNSYSFLNPYPGTWYWRVQDDAGNYSEVRSFTVQAPQRLSFAISEPAPGAAIAGNGGAVSWGRLNKVAFYRVEFSNTGKWATPNYVFATSGTTIQTKDIVGGQYQMRVGGFSEISGQWEYSQPISVSVQ